MIRKPPADWARPHEGAAVRTVRTATAAAKGSVSVARRGGHAARGLACWFFAALWAVTGIPGGLATGSLPMILGVGAMVAFMVWVGSRAFAKARATSG